MSLPKGCDHCNKSSLSLLLVRPSPVARAIALSSRNISAVLTAPSDLLTGLIPARMPTDSRYVLRLLRAGYVHVYIPHPPRAQKKNWLTFRVTDEADLIPEDRPAFAQPDSDLPCLRREHNRTGLKVLTIPQAHEISEIWLASSANLWNATLRDRNKANPQAMQRIALSGESDNTFLPTVENLEAYILECKLTKRGTFGWEKPLFPYHELCRSNGCKELAENLVAAANSHPKTRGKERVVVLRDPVGIAAELNWIRLRRYELLRGEMKKPEHQHALQSATITDGLRKSIQKSNEQIAVTKVSERLTKLEFNRRHWPPGTEWFELDDKSKALLPKESIPINRSGTYIQYRMRDADKMGMVRFSDHDARASTWARQETDKTWSSFVPYIDSEARARWFETFSAMLKEKHEASLERLELDWSTASDDEITINYFVDHFDSADPNDIKEKHSPGATYSRENSLIRTPAPHTRGSVLDAYLKHLSADINDEHAIMLRAIVSNQQEFFTAVQQQLTADPGEGMRDKTFDILKDLKVVKKYSWLADGVGVFGYGQACAISAALISLASRTEFDTVFFGKICLKSQLLWGIQQATEHLRKAQIHASISGSLPNRPVLIVAQVPAALAMEVNSKLATQLNGISPSDLEKLRRGGQSIPVTLMTDTDALRSGRISMREMILRGGAQTTQIGPAADAAHQAAKDANQATATHKQILKLAREQITMGTRAAAHIGEFLSGPTTNSLDAVVNSIDGRLAIGLLIVQVIGFTSSASALWNLEKHTDVDKRAEAELSFYDSLGANGVLMMIGGVGLSVSGIGLILLGAGLALQLGAMALTPSDIQKWFSRSYFGKNREVLWFSMGNREDRFLTLEEEMKCLDKLLPKSNNS